MIIKRKSKRKMYCQTGNDSLWSTAQRMVKIHRIEAESFDEYGCYIRAYFNLKTWNPYSHGLIYTDSKWLKDFRKLLRSRGFSQSAVNSVSYTEQGMQGDNYVSLSGGRLFAEEWLRKYPESALV